MSRRQNCEPVSRRPTRRLVTAVVVLAYVAGTIAARRRGYPMGGSVVVRCRANHLFTTIWIPGVSAKSLRLGWYRLQRCPVGQHWTLVRPVREADLSDDDRRTAHEKHDVRIP